MPWTGIPLSTVHGNQYVRIYVSTHLRIYVSTYQRTYVVSNCPQFARGFPRNVRGFLQIAHDSALGFGAVWRGLAPLGAVWGLGFAYPAQVRDYAER